MFVKPRLAIAWRLHEVWTILVFSCPVYLMFSHALSCVLVDFIVSLLSPYVGHISDSSERGSANE